MSGEEGGVFLFSFLAHRPLSKDGVTSTTTQRCSWQISGWFARALQKHLPGICRASEAYVSGGLLLRMFIPLTELRKGDAGRRRAICSAGKQDSARCGSLAVVCVHACLNVLGRGNLNVVV